MCKGEDQQLLDGRTIPSSIILRNSFLAAAKSSGASLRGRHTTGGPGVVSI
jgi:hypothetical protein